MMRRGKAGPSAGDQGVGGFASSFRLRPHVLLDTLGQTDVGALLIAGVIPASSGVRRV